MRSASIIPRTAQQTLKFIATEPGFMECLLTGRGSTDQSCIASEQTVPIMHACVQRILKFIGVFVNLTDVKSCVDRSRIFREADYKPMHKTLSVRLLPQPATAMVGSIMYSALLACKVPCSRVPNMGGVRWR